MEIIRGIHNIKPHHRGCVVTVGNFDGVHLGHQKILAEVRAKADELGVSSLLMCFEPQPREFFDVFNAPARLTRFREKVELFERHGVDFVLCMQFNERFRSLSASDFVDILVDDLQVRCLCIGDDYRFGRDQSGDYSLLLEAGKREGFELFNLYTIEYDSERISSTRIRECLKNGDFETAEKLLGHPYSIAGKVVYGRQLGSQLGVPTANIQLHRYVAPIAGVYACEIVIDDTTWQGVANVGVRPTVEVTVNPVLEVHVFDFNDLIYGKIVKVTFRHKIREEMKFTGLEALKVAIHADIEAARQFFGSAA